MPRDPRSPDRWFRRLLLLFPFEFRRNHGADMAATLRDEHRDAARQGRVRRMGLWLDTVLGALRVGPRRHLAGCWEDARDAVRSLRSSPVFTAAAVAALALGVGANTAVFGLVHAVLIRPLPVTDASRVLVIQLQERRDGRFSPLSTDNFRDVRDRQRSFSSVAAFGGADVTLGDADEARPLWALAVGGAYFGVLDVPAGRGRTIQPADDRDGSGDAVAVLSYRLWSAAFDRDAAVLGRTVRLNGRPFVVVGILPESFRGTTGLREPDLYVPLGAYATLIPDVPWVSGRLWRWLNAIGRLAPGVAASEAVAELATLGDRLAEEFPDFNRGRTLTAMPLKKFVFGPNDYATFERTGTTAHGGRGRRAARGLRQSGEPDARARGLAVPRPRAQTGPRRRPRPADATGAD